MWAKLLSALAKIAASLFVKNPESQRKAEVIGQAVDLTIETVEAEKAKKP